MRAQEETDFSLYERFLKGDEGALERLIERHRQKLFRFLYGYVQDTDAAEELFSDVFMTLYFKRGFVQKETGSFQAYLYKIARNKALNHLKKVRRRKEISLTALLEKGDEWQTERALSPLTPLSPTADPHDAMENAEQKRALFSALQQVKGIYREILLLRYYDGFTPKEIARLTKRTEKQVYNLLQRSKAALKKYYHEKGEHFENHQTLGARRHEKNQTP